MTLKPCSLMEALTTHEYNDVTGVVTVNIADGLMAIAAAINRLAATNERMVAIHEQNAAEASSIRRQVAAMANSDLEPGGHA